MRTLAVIPARLGATRLPRKPLRLLGGVPLVLRVWERVREIGVADDCVIATDSAEVASVAVENDLWFHIDGAYGAPGAMVDSKRRLFDGMERADSLSLDPHKWLYTPIDCGCLLFRDPARARAAFATDADYIKVQEQTEMESFAFWDYGIELSRRFRALKIWLTLRHYGVRRDGTARDTVMYSILAAEWPDVRRHLELRLARHAADGGA